MFVTSSSEIVRVKCSILIDFSKHSQLSVCKSQTCSIIINNYLIILSYIYYLYIYLYVMEASNYTM